MEFPPPHPVPLELSFFSSALSLPFHPRNTPESHIFSAEIPGVRKEELRVEVEDSGYLIIRTEAVDEFTGPARKFMRKFRLPDRIDLDAISSGY